MKNKYNEDISPYLPKKTSKHLEIKSSPYLPKATPKIIKMLPSFLRKHKSPYEL